MSDSSLSVTAISSIETSSELSPRTTNKHPHRHLNYIPWEPSRAAISRTDYTGDETTLPSSSALSKHARPSPPSQSISTQLFRYQNNNKSPSPTPTPTAVAGKETFGFGSKVKPTATVEPFQASINVDEILYGVRPVSPINHSTHDLNSSGDHHELKIELERVQDENAGLKQQLELQTQVNAELKKLLVASVGTDFQYKLERLLRDKSRYELEIQILTRKINDLLEEIEKLMIQCDIYQSKAAASRVLIDEITAHKSVLNVQYRDCSNTIQRLLAERAQIAKELIGTHRLLANLNEITLNNTRKHLSPSPKFDLIQLSTYLQTLASSLFTYLKQTVYHNQTNFNTNQRHIGIQLELTEAETRALEILQTHTSAMQGSASSIPSLTTNTSDIEALQAMVNRLKLVSKKKSHERFHPTTRYENLTLNCCRDCSGEIHVV